MKLIAAFLLFPAYLFSQKPTEDIHLFMNDVLNSMKTDVASSKYALTAEDMRILSPDLKEEQLAKIAASTETIYKELYGPLQKVKDLPVTAILDTATITEKNYSVSRKVFNVVMRFRRENKPYSIHNTGDQSILSFCFAEVAGKGLKLVMVKRENNDWNPADYGYHSKFYEARKLTEARYPDVFEDYYYKAEEDIDLVYIPFRQNGKWGLKDHAGKTVYKAEADTIYPELDGFRMVAVKGGKNLLDSNLKYYFAQPVKTILRGPRYFFSPLNDKSGPLKTYSKTFGWSKAPVMKPGVTYYRSLTRYIFSNDNKVFKPLNIEHLREIFAGETEEDVSMIGAGKDRKYERSVYELKTNYSADFAKLVFTLKRTEDGKTEKTFTGWENLTHWHDYLVGNRNDSTYLMNYEGSILFSTRHFAYPLGTSGYPDDPYILYLFDASTGLFGAYFTETKMLIEPEYRSLKVEKSKPDYILVTTPDHTYGFLDRNGKKLF